MAAPPAFGPSLKLYLLIIDLDTDKPVLILLSVAEVEEKDTKKLSVRI